MADLLLLCAIAALAACGIACLVGAHEVGLAAHRAARAALSGRARHVVMADRLRRQP